MVGDIGIAHRDPDVGHDAIRAGNRFHRIGGDMHARAALPGPAHDLGRRRQFVRHSQPQFEIELDRSMDPGGGHIVAVAAPGDRPAPDRAAMFLEGHHIGHELAGMGPVRQPVDHRHVRVRGQLQQLLFLRAAQHDRIDIAREHAGRVRHGLAAAELAAPAFQHDRVAAELPDRPFERNARPGRRLLEDHRQRLAVQRTGWPRAGPLFIRGRFPGGFHALADLDDAAQFGLPDQVEVQKVPDARGRNRVAVQARRDAGVRHRSPLPPSALPPPTFRLRRAAGRPPRRSRRGR